MILSLDKYKSTSLNQRKMNFITFMKMHLLHSDIMSLCLFSQVYLINWPTSQACSSDRSCTTKLPFMLLFIDPIVYIVHAFDAKDTALHEGNVHMERSMGLKHRTAVYKDGEWVCAVVHFMC